MPVYLVGIKEEKAIARLQEGGLCGHHIDMHAHPMKTLRCPSIVLNAQSKQSLGQDLA